MKQKASKSGIGFDGMVRYLIERDYDEFMTLKTPDAGLSHYPIEACYRKLKSPVDEFDHVDIEKDLDRT